MEYGNLDRKRPGSAAALNWVFIHCDVSFSQFDKQMFDI